MTDDYKILYEPKPPEPKHKCPKFDYQFKPDGTVVRCNKCWKIWRVQRYPDGLARVYPWEVQHPEFPGFIGMASFALALLIITVLSIIDPSWW